MRVRKASGSLLNGRNKGKRRSRRPKRNKDIAKAGRHHIRMTPCLFAFIWFSSVSVALLAWWRACASLHWGNRCSHNGQRKQIIRTRLLYPIGSKFGLYWFAYVCRKRCRRKALRSVSGLDSGAELGPWPYTVRKREIRGRPCGGQPCLQVQRNSKHHHTLYQAV